MKVLKLIFSLILFPFVLLSQEIITDLSVNAHKKNSISSEKPYQKSEKSSHVFLPFKDDFSNPGIFPNYNLWEDRNVFINNTYPINPITVGVATFDALNEFGEIYAHANPSSFIADYLTSKKVRLDSVYQGPNLIPLKVSDSLYFSFYFQPQGIGNRPEGHDSLVLEFFSHADSMWYWIWSAPGQSYQSFYNTYQRDFGRVLIPITDSLRFFHKDFQFRFMNYASIANTYESSWAGNVDHWHIDYVYLNAGRNKNDTIYEDVAFTERPKSLLKNYQSVPWPHYKANPTAFQMNSSLTLPYVNLSDITKNVNRNFFIIDLDDASTDFNYSGGNLNLLSFQQENFNIPVSHTFSTAQNDTALFQLKAIINTTPDINRRNDTVVFLQRFHNYYAYDDGSPENGYGLTPAGSKLAYRFSVNTTDTLKAVKMFFNQTFENASQKNFFLTVWTGNNEPSQIVYEKENIRPEYEDELNKFYTYYLDPPLVLNGTFYVGWRQTTSDNLNIGFDRNINSNSNIFYNVDGTWKTSMYEGSLMIRPVFGQLYNTANTEKLPNNDEQFVAFPNPLYGNEVHFRMLSNDVNMSIRENQYTFSLFDMVGRLVYKSDLKDIIYLPENLNGGMYFYSIYGKDNTVVSNAKLIIVK